MDRDIILLLFLLVSTAVVDGHDRQDLSSFQLKNRSFFFDPFLNLDKWTVVSNDKYQGQWSVEVVKPPTGIPFDEGLVMKTPASYHAIFTRLKQTIVLKQHSLVLQYEVRYQNHPVSCAGTYMKLLRTTPTASDFSGDTPYVIMFGPDVCGSSKVHFIFTSLNPITNKYEQHHLVNPPSVQNDGFTHLYTLILDPKTNDFQIKIDDKIIPDPKVQKPNDWDDRLLIPDPSVRKPLYWDQPEFIPDPDAVKPDDWNEDADGEWEPAVVANPEFYGEWIPPMVLNPDYNGKFEAPIINNPNYFQLSQPLKKMKVEAIGMEVWTLDQDILIDNVLLTHDETVAMSLAKETFHVKQANEVEETSVDAFSVDHELKAVVKETFLLIIRVFSNSCQAIDDVLPVGSVCSLVVLTILFVVVFQPFSRDYKQVVYPDLKVNEGSKKIGNDDKSVVDQIDEVQPGENLGEANGMKPNVHDELVDEVLESAEVKHQSVLKTTVVRKPADVLESVSMDLEEQPLDQQAAPPVQFVGVNVADLMKKIKGVKTVPEKLEVLESELFSGMNVNLTVKEIETITATFSNASDRLTAVELLSRHVQSFDVPTVTSLVSKMSDVDGKMKMLEACLPKLAYALPWDCEPIYKYIPGDKRGLARELIASVQTTFSVEFSVPTNDMLIKASAVTVPDIERMNILRSWLASVSNPVFSPDELTKLVQEFTSFQQRLQVLEEMLNLTETLSVKQTVALLTDFPFPSIKLDAIRVVAHKMEYQSDSDLEPLLSLFSSAKFKQSVRSVFEFTSMELEQVPVEENLKYGSTSEMGQTQVYQQSISQEQHEDVPQTVSLPEVNNFNFAEFKKMIGAAKSVDQKLEVIESELSSAFDVTLTLKEVQNIAMTFSKDVDRVRAIELLSRHFESFTVSDVISLLAKLSEIDAKLKVIEDCSHKLVFALPWDCEPIYKVLPWKEQKALAREILAAVQSSNSVEPSVPTNEMLIKSVGSCSLDEEKMNILYSWLSSVQNPVFSPDELTKLMKNFRKDDLCVQVLFEISKFSETFNAEQMLGLMKVLSTPASRLKALPVIAYKLVYHFDSELETLHKVFSSTIDKDAVYSIIESLSMKRQGEFQPGEPNIPDLIKKLKRCAQTADKHRIVRSDVFSVSNVLLTTEECIAIMDTFKESEDRTQAFEILSANIQSFTVSDVPELLRMVARDDELKVVEICSPKLVYSLPFDCEPIYNAIDKDQDKTTARSMITCQGVGITSQAGDVIPVHPTVDMLFEAFGHSPSSSNEVPTHLSLVSFALEGLGRRSVKAPEKVNVLSSWLASVPNPNFTFEEVVKLLEDFYDDAEDDVKQGNRLEVLQMVNGIMESPLSVDQVKELLNLFTNHQRRMNALLLIVGKVVFQTLWQLEEIIRMFKTSTHRKKVRSVLESIKCNQDFTFQPKQPQKVSESSSQSDMIPYLISQFFTEDASQSELFSGLASHVSTFPEFTLTSKTFKVIMSFFTIDDEVLKAIAFLSPFIQSITIDLLVFLLGQLGHAANDEKLRAVEICAGKFVYDDLYERDKLHGCFIYNAGDKAIEIIESHRTSDVPRKIVPTPTMEDLMEAIKEAVDSKEQLVIVRSWAASVPNPLICVNDFEELLSHFPTEKDTVASILGDATYFRKRPYLPNFIDRIIYSAGSSNEKIVRVGRLLGRERNLLLTPWDLAVLVSCFSEIKGKMKLIELCSPHLEYECRSDCDVIYQCISGKANKAMAKKLMKSSKDSSALETFVDNWDKDDAQFWNMNPKDLRFQFMVLTEAEFWAWLKTFHFDEMRDRAYQQLITKIIPPPSWA
ncbi:hypothetical protein GEMRC1_008089 [Eukaryota sp. GEM-RC1]